MSDNLGRRLRKAREKRNYTQDDLAAAVPGASQAMISALERRNSETTTLLFEFADELQVNPEWLLTGKGDSWLEDAQHAMQAQLIEIYSQLDQDGRDTLLGRANALLSEQKPGGKHDPFGRPQKRSQRAPGTKKVSPA